MGERVGDSTFFTDRFAPQIMSRTRTRTSSAFTFAMGVMGRWPTAVPAATRLSYLQTTTESWICWSMATRVKSVLRLSKRKCERCRAEVARGNKVVQPEPNDTHPSEEDGETTGTKERRLY